jgi:hypothetical protein
VSGRLAGRRLIPEGGARRLSGISIEQAQKARTSTFGLFAFPSVAYATQQAASLQLLARTLLLARQALSAAPTAATRWWPEPVNGTRRGAGAVGLSCVPLTVHFQVAQPPCA